MTSLSTAVSTARAAMEVFGSSVPVGGRACERIEVCTVLGDLTF